MKAIFVFALFVAFCYASMPLNDEGVPLTAAEMKDENRKMMDNDIGRIGDDNNNNGEGVNHNDIDLDLILKLKSGDGEVFEVKKSIAIQSQLIKDLCENLSDDEELPIPNLKGPMLAKMIYLMNLWKDVEKKPTEADVKECFKSVKPLKTSEISIPEDYVCKTAGFVDTIKAIVEPMEGDELYEFIMGANFLNYRYAMEIAAQKYAILIKQELKKNQK